MLERRQLAPSMMGSHGIGTFDWVHMVPLPPNTKLSGRGPGATVKREAADEAPGPLQRLVRLWTKLVDLTPQQLYLPLWTAIRYDLAATH